MTHELRAGYYVCMLLLVLSCIPELLYIFIKSLDIHIYNQDFLQLSYCFLAHCSPQESWGLELGDPNSQWHILGGISPPVFISSALSLDY
jgi:hypothetical protein